MPGAMIRAMLAAYRRTLQKTMEQARSMQQVVDEAGLDWLETPDQAVVWGTALGLQGEIEGVLERSLEDVREQPSMASATYFPAWYRTSDGSSFASGIAAGSGGSIFSGSAVPDLGGMMSALGTIGNSPSSSGSGGGGLQRRRFGRRRRRLGRRVLGLDAPNMVPASVQALDLDRWSRLGTPALLGHPEALGLARDPLWGEGPAPVVLVAERARDAVGRRVVEKRLGRRDLGAQTVEREGEHGLAHLLAQAPPCQRRVSHDPVSTVRCTAKLFPHARTASRSAARRARPSGSRFQSSGVQVARISQ